jgi:hypothetical protein
MIDSTNITKKSFLYPLYLPHPPFTQVNKLLHQEFLSDQRAKGRVQDTQAQAPNMTAPSSSSSSNRNTASAGTNTAKSKAALKGAATRATDSDTHTAKMEGSAAMRTNSMRVSQVAAAFAGEARVLCFDEFQLTDVCDALLVKQLFEELWSVHGVAVVLTSNRPPKDIYLNG